MSPVVWPWVVVDDPPPTEAMVVLSLPFIHGIVVPLNRQRFIRLYAVLPLSGPPPRTTAEGDDCFDSLKESGKAVSLPGPGGDRTLALAEIGVEQARFSCFVGHG